MPRPDAYLRLFAAQLQTAPRPLWWSQFLVRKGGCKPSGFSIIIFEPVLDACPNASGGRIAVHCSVVIEHGVGFAAAVEGEKLSEVNYWDGRRLGMTVPRHT